ncbi:MAG: mechanosensitive ion channel domain-containing protein [Pirellulaceae bacterium]
MPSPTDVLRNRVFQSVPVVVLFVVLTGLAQSPVCAQVSPQSNAFEMPNAGYSQSTAAPQAIFKPRGDANTTPQRQPAERVARGSHRPGGFVRQVSHLQDAPNSELTVETVQAELDSLDTHTELDDEQRDRFQKTLKQSLKWLVAQQEANKHLQQFKDQIKNAPIEIKRLREKLNQPLPNNEVFIPDGASLTQLEAQITELDLRTQADQKLLDEISQKIDSRTQRVSAITKEISDLEKRIADTKAAPVDAKEDDFQNHVLRIETQARLQSMTAQLELLRVESKRFDALAEQWPLERDFADRQLSSSQQKLDAWKKTVEQWRRDESTRYAVATRQLAEKSHPALKALATRNAEIAELRVHTAKEIQTISTEVTKLSGLKTQLEDSFQSLVSKVEHAPQATSTGILLRKQKTELPRRSDCDQRAARLNHDTPAAHLLLMELKDERRAISDPVATGQELVNAMGDEIAEFDPNQVLRAVTVLLQTRRDLLAKLIADQDKLLRDLSELEVINHDLSQQITGFRGFLDEHVLWVRSDEMLGIKDLQKATVATGSLFKFSRWTTAIRSIVGETMRGPWAMGFAFALLLCAFTFRQHLSRRLKQLCTPPVHAPFSPPQPMQFGMSLSGLAISILLSASWPAILLAVGYKLSSADGTDEFTGGLGKAFIAVAALIWGSQIIREICVENQVGHRMFGWPPRVLTSVRRTLELTVLVAAPLIGILVLAQNVMLTGGESLHRLTLMLTLVFVAIQSYSLLRPGGAVMQAITRMSPQSMIAKMQRPICFALMAVPLILAGISAYGYHYSATQLSFRFAESLVAILGIIVLHALALRWLRLKGYNRTVREQYAKYQAQVAALEASATAGADDGSVQRAETIEEQEIKWEETADIHIRELLRYVTIVTLLVGGWFIWAEVLPALRVLDRVTLWDNVVKVSEVISDSSGRSILDQYETNVPTTLKDVIVACLVIFGTLMIGKRMTSLLEVTVLQRLPIDMGGRNAVSILMRYALTLAGLLVACHVIRLSWSSVQWLAAAMTVGLGFGLQEIFANLVSGLIILFERPIRAGDIVTIGDVTGTVSRMQIRATTITDFDRRELIVPNKSFITGNVINWTLTDPVCRTIVHVGVAYGSDTARVESILLSVARRCPMVLDAPEPCVVFGGFGSSTLDFELRAFIGQRESRSQINSALYMAINREFNQAGIEIAFPQQDLHVRSINGVSTLPQAIVGNAGSKAA